MNMPDAPQAETCFAAATQRWPRVGWPLAAYAAHAEPRSLAHPCDLYLAGAAGHRLDTAWEEFNGEITLKCRNTQKRKKWGDDEEQQQAVWEKVLDGYLQPADNHPRLPDGQFPTRLIDYGGRCALVTYICNMLKLRAIDQIRENERRRKKGEATASSPALEAFEPGRLDPQLGPMADRELVGLLRPRVEEAWQKMNDRQRALLRMVVFEGIKSKTAAEVLEIDPSNVTRAWPAIHGLMEATFEGLVEKDDVSPELRQEWIAVWRKLCLGSENPDGPQADPPGGV